MLKHFQKYLMLQGTDHEVQAGDKRWAGGENEKKIEIGL